MIGQEAIDQMLDDLEMLVNDPQYMMEHIHALREVLQKKGEDNAGQGEMPGSVFNNFLLQALLSGLPEPEQAFYVMLTRKVVRLIVSQQGGKTPNYEGIADSWLDLTGYAVLLAAYEHFKERYGTDALRIDRPQPSSGGIRPGAVPSLPGSSDSPTE